MAKTAACIVDQQRYQVVDGMRLEELETSLRQMILKDFPQAHNSSFICSEHLVHYRLAKMDAMIENDYQQNDKVNAQLSKILANHTSHHLFNYTNLRRICPVKDHQSKSDYHE